VPGVFTGVPAPRAAIKYSRSAAACTPVAPGRPALPLTLVSDGLNCFQVAASASAVHDRDEAAGLQDPVVDQSVRQRAWPNAQTCGRVGRTRHAWWPWGRTANAMVCDDLSGGVVRA
jgi:hypothetical protein